MCQCFLLRIVSMLSTCLYNYCFYCKYMLLYVFCYNYAMFWNKYQLDPKINLCRLINEQ